MSLVVLLSSSAPSSPDVSPQSSPRPPRANNDRLTLLTRLVRKGEKKGLFVEKMPASIYQVDFGCSEGLTLFNYCILLVFYREIPWMD